MWNWMLYHSTWVLTFVWLLISFLWHAAHPRDRGFGKIATIVLSCAIFGTYCPKLIAIIGRLRPLKYDLYIYRLDGLLGFEPSFSLAKLIRPHLWLFAGVLAAYYGLMVMIAFALVIQLKRGDPVLPIIQAFLINAFAAIPFYLLIPVSGPYYAFPQFPHLPGPVSPHPALINFPPNGVPSLHMSAALLLAYFARKWTVLRWVFWLFCGITVIATLAIGEHYLFDLLAAVPYTYGVLWLNEHLVSQIRQQQSDCHATVELNS